LTSTAIESGKEMKKEIKREIVQKECDLRVSLKKSLMDNEEKKVKKIMNKKSFTLKTTITNTTKAITTSKKINQM
jgi:hypothetical protein